MQTTSTTVVSTSWLGVDVSAKTFDACLCPPEVDPTSVAQLHKMRVSHFERTPDGAARMVARYAGRQPVCIVMEATGRYSSQLAAWICDADAHAQVCIVHARRVRNHAKALGLRSKTDRADARLIASYGAKFAPAAYRLPESDQLTLRTLMRTRHGLVEQQTALTNQRADLARANGLDGDCAVTLNQTLSDLIDDFQHKVADIDKALNDLKLRNLQLGSDLDLVDKIPGIGPITGSTILGELGDIRRFAKRRQMETFVGLDIRRHQSGTSRDVSLGLTREGAAGVRWALYLAAMAASKTQTALGDHYRQMLARNKPKKVALGALMRKILSIIRAVIITGKPYDDKLARKR
jgi:transposase